MPAYIGNTAIIKNRTPRKFRRGSASLKGWFQVRLNSCIAGMIVSTGFKSSGVKIIFFVIQYPFHEKIHERKQNTLVNWIYTSEYSTTEAEPTVIFDRPSEYAKGL